MSFVTWLNATNPIEPQPDLTLEYFRTVIIPKFESKTGISLTPEPQKTNFTDIEFTLRYNGVTERLHMNAVALFSGRYVHSENATFLDAVVFLKIGSFRVLTTDEDDSNPHLVFRYERGKNNEYEWSSEGWQSDAYGEYDNY